MIDGNDVRRLKFHVSEMKSALVLDKNRNYNHSEDRTNDWIKNDMVHIHYASLCEHDSNFHISMHII